MHDHKLYDENLMLSFYKTVSLDISPPTLFQENKENQFYLREIKRKITRKS